MCFFLTVNPVKQNEQIVMSTEKNEKLTLSLLFVRLIIYHPSN